MLLSRTKNVVHSGLPKLLVPISAAKPNFDKPSETIKNPETEPGPNSFQNHKKIVFGLHSRGLAGVVCFCNFYRICDLLGGFRLFILNMLVIAYFTSNTVVLIKNA